MSFFEFISAPACLARPVGSAAVGVFVVVSVQLSLVDVLRVRIRALVRRLTQKVEDQRVVGEIPPSQHRHVWVPEVPWIGLPWQDSVLPMLRVFRPISPVLLPPSRSAFVVFFLDGVRRRAPPIYGRECEPGDKCQKGPSDLCDRWWEGKVVGVESDNELTVEVILATLPSIEPILRRRQGWHRVRHLGLRIRHPLCPDTGTFHIPQPDWRHLGYRRRMWRRALGAETGRLRPEKGAADAGWP